MAGECDSLNGDFPDHIPLIQNLRDNHPEFASVADEYDRLDKLIYRIERGEEASSDAYLEECKLELVRLKDMLFNIIRQHNSGE